MEVTFHLGEPFWRAVGKREVRLTLGDGATVAEALTALTRLYPALSAELGGDEVRPMIFMNEADVFPEALLTPEARLTIVWPVSGG